MLTKLSNKKALDKTIINLLYNKKARYINSILSCNKTKGDLLCKISINDQISKVEFNMHTSITVFLFLWDLGDVGLDFWELLEIRKFVTDEQTENFQFVLQLQISIKC